MIYKQNHFVTIKCRIYFTTFFYFVYDLVSICHGEVITTKDTSHVTNKIADVVGKSLFSSKLYLVTLFIFSPFSFMPQKNKVSDLRQKIVYVPIDILNPANYNPRKHSERQLQNLMESIRKYGMIDPIIVNNTPERKQVVIG